MNPGDDFSEVLRRALHAEAESVMPAPDALDRIRARTAAKPRWSWFLTDWSKPLLAAAAAVLMGAAVFSGGPAAIERISSVGQNSKAEQAARQKSASSVRADQQNSLVPVGPGGQPLPSGVARVTCEPIAAKTAKPARPRRSPAVKITPSPVPHPAPTAVVVPTGARESAWKSMSCPPSMTPSLVPSAKAPATTPVPTGTVPVDPSPGPTTPPVSSHTPTPDPPSTPPQDTSSPSAPASSIAPTEPTASPS
jgi:hypothetical protein